MADQVKTNQYKVYYKFPNQPSVKWDYCAPSLAQLMRNLQHSEGVNSQRVEFLFIHQIHSDGKVSEVISIDNQGKEVVSTTSKALTLVEPEEETAYDKSVLDRVTELLLSASKTVTSDHPKPRIKLKSRRSIIDYDFYAKPATC